MPMIGAAQHIGRLKRLASPATIAAVGKALYAGADMIKAEAQHLITEGSVSGRGHVASAPGEPPNNDTSVLKSNIEAVSKGPLLAEVSSNAEYAAALEFGSERKAGKTTRSFAGKTTLYGPNKAKQGPVLVEYGDSTTAARPHMAPARDKRRAEVVALIVDAVNRQNRKGE